MNLRSNIQIGCLLLTSILAGSLTGCDSGDAGGRQSVTGTVNFAGQPLADGNILFRPMSGGQTAGSPIEQGSFLVPRDKGLLPGKYRVEIKAMRPVGEKYIDSESGREEQDREQFIPPKYNVRTEITKEVTAGGENRFEFELTASED